MSHTLWRKTYSFFFMALLCTMTVGAQELSTDTASIGDTLSIEVPSSTTHPLLTTEASDTILVTEARDSLTTKVRPWKALGETFAVNAVTHGFARFLLNFDYAQTTLSTIRNNFKAGFAWDVVFFYMNHVGHTYQGSVYFNTGRFNGLTFWQSIPYTVLGSLTWEFLGETEQPSINDVVTTVFSGTLMGEVSNRMVRLVINDREKGVKRLAREAVATFLYPVEGFYRLISGRMWKVRHDMDDVTAEKEPSDEVKVTGYLTVGDRYLKAIGQHLQGRHQPFLAFDMEYGQMDDEERHLTPYDFFTIDATLALCNKHPLSDIHITGRLCSMPAFSNERARGEIGIYQHFIYEDRYVPADSSQTPFPIGEMASLGPGMMFVVPNLTPRLSFEQRVFSKGILLGAIKSDYYKFYNRNYNMGSGFGAVTWSKLTWENVGALLLKAQYMHLFTWKGYEPKDISGLVFDNTYLNVLGDKSDARLLTLDLKLQARISRQMGLALEASYYSRHTHYKYHPDKKAEAYVLWGGVEWNF